MFDGIADFFESIQKGMAMPPSAATLAKQKKVGRYSLVLRGESKSRPCTEFYVQVPAGLCTKLGHFPSSNTLGPVARPVSLRVFAPLL